MAKDDLVTKDYLDHRLSKTEQRFKNELWKVKQDFEDKVGEAFRKYRDDTLKGLSKVMEELEKNRQERIIQQHHHEELKERVKKLEAHALS